MKHKRKRKRNDGKRVEENKVDNRIIKLSAFTKCMIFIIIFSFMLLVLSYNPRTTEEETIKFYKMKEQLGRFIKNLTECARQVKASIVEVEYFLKRIPQATMQGKCFVACILKRNSIIKNNKIAKENLLEVNRALYGEHNEVMSRLITATDDCSLAVEDIFDICEYASVFNDCIDVKMHHILEKVTSERMEATGQTSGADTGMDEDEVILRMVRDEL